MRVNKHLFEIKKNSYGRSTDSDRNPDSVFIRRKREGLFMIKGRGTIMSIEGRHFYWCR